MRWETLEGPSRIIEKTPQFFSASAIFTVVRPEVRLQRGHLPAPIFYIQVQHELFNLLFSNINSNDPFVVVFLPQPQTTALGFSPFSLDNIRLARKLKQFIFIWNK